MDKIEGIRGTASIESDLDMNMNNITELEESVVPTDAVVQAEIAGQGLDITDSPTFADITITNDASIGDELTVVGSSSLAALLLSGALTGTSITLTGNFLGTTMTLSGALNGTSITLTGAFNGTTVTLTGAFNGTTGAFTGTITCAAIESTGSYKYTDGAGQIIHSFATIT